MAETNSKTKEYFRPPVVTIMGHVDHGKTSILDYIRKTNVQAREYGGITQHIGAYQISYKNKKITFIDTPGHEAFSQMRSRGGKAADIVILVVAGDSSVQPQTKEAIKHAQAANVQMIVAINKVDLASANVQKVKQDLAQENVLVEDWGGNIIAVEVSAKSGAGIPELLEAITTVAEMMELRADPSSELEATIIESRLDRNKGVTVTAIVKTGTLHIGDEVFASGTEAKVRTLFDQNGSQTKEALPSDPVEILGFKEAPHVGDLIVQKGSELAELAQDTDRIEIIGLDTKRAVSIIVKADTQGTLEAVKGSLAKLVTEAVGADYSLKFIRTATGDINDSDVMLASNTGSAVVGFNAKLKSSVVELADDLDVNVKVFKTIYELIDEVKALLEGTAKKEVAKIKGRAQVLKKFKLPSGDIVAGSKIIAGQFKVNDRVAVYDKNPTDLTDQDIPLHRASIKKLKSGRDDVDKVLTGSECGILLKPTYEGMGADLWIEAV